MNQQTKMSQNANYPFVVLGMGCFWGAEKRMLSLAGVVDVESGYANGEIDASYEAILAHERKRRMGLSELKNHVEVVKVWFDPAKTTLEQVLAQFWESHNPTQGDRQGNDVGSNYRSAIFTATEQDLPIAEASRKTYQQALDTAGFSQITTDITLLMSYTPAETYHQRYLQKNPNGYCGLGGTGVAYPSSQAFRPYPEWTLVIYGQQTAFAEDQFCNEVLKHYPLPFELRWQESASPLTLQLEQKGRPSAEFADPFSPPYTEFWRWLGHYLLTEEQHYIAFSQGTERPFCGPYLTEKRRGWFLDPLSGVPLFHSDTKFDSGTGWPSFFDVVADAVTLVKDRSHGMIRTEVRSASTGIHLGHVFEDGPAPTHLRYCINGQVLLFKHDV
ncbi:peptide-methionine (S)-S-oxide reductase MsrA [Thiomicrospira cyclica]|uniref:Peptide methionine sulfoxide reductase MsrA n=1 Tax=Thiomicrospira cyclica (strain DSM 14477 / JCM 11371 / ALM1) TaxID=717773 RepID=F6DD39_THICA|nr:peptide-methionine (S)-S-oxide reductase MsrA [Thiomicrospira cyclica]AEG31775.1 Peptide methionine sulfoxide reductase msrA [Thiomicrospira cyclica ALM1]